MRTTLRTDQLLSDARQLIDLPDLWCQDARARDSGNSEVSPFEETAAAFCIVGAIHRAAYNTICQQMNADTAKRLAVQGSILAVQCIDAAVNDLKLPVQLYAGQLAEAFNDCHSHAEMLDLIDSAHTYGEIEVFDGG